jgi:protein-tyrosine phosphatase
LEKIIFSRAMPGIIVLNGGSMRKQPVVSILASLVFFSLTLLGCSDEGSSGDARPSRDSQFLDGQAADSIRIDDSALPPCVRGILENDVTNARDLGDHPLDDGYRVACRKILRGGDLCQLSQEGCDELLQLGIKTVIDLRQQQVQQSEPPASCVSSQASNVSAAMPRLLPDNPANYLALLNEKSAVAQVFSTLGDAQSYPVYIHCVIGRDRASFVTALILLALGADRSTVIDEFNLSADVGVPVKQPCIEAVLDVIDTLGGIEPYLASCGVTSDQMATLRAQACIK